MTYDNSLFKKIEELESLILEREDDYVFNDDDAYEFWHYINEKNCYFNEDNTNFACGASKFCLVPCKEDFVIKIPFNSLWIEGEYDEDVGYADGDYAPLTNYCQLEYNNYKKAKEKFPGAEKFLAETRHLYSGNLDIYVQDKADGYYEIYDENGSIDEVVESSDSDKFKSLINSGAGSNIPAYWFEDLLNYGLENDEMDAVNSFLDFLMETKINDLCGRNVGYIHGKPVLFDYSGWYGPEGSDWVAY